MSETPYWLAPHVQATAVDDDVVFLDVAGDAYTCLPEGVRLLRLADDRRSARIEDPDLAHELETAGFLHRVPAVTALPWRAVPAATASALRIAYPPPRWRDLGAAAVTLADLWRRYRGQSFARIVAAAHDQRAPTPPPIELARVEAIVDRFHRWIPYAPVSGKCLLRSFALLRHLQRAGLDPAWVFGVRTWPFEAHCWLQVETMVLDDHADRVRAFTPILVV